MKQRILHITWTMAIGGAERALYQLIRAQRENGLESDLLIARDASFYGDVTGQTGARVFALGQKSATDFSVKRRFLEVIEDYDILHFHAASPLLMHLASSKKKRLFYTHRGGSHKFGLKRLLMYKIAGFYLRNYFAGISGNTDHAASVAYDFFNIPGEKRLTTYNGIDFSLLKPKRTRQDILTELKDPDNGVIRIGTSANLRELKRIDYLIKAISQIRDLPVRCYIIGDGPARSSLEKMTRDLAIEKLIIFTGTKEHMGDYLQVLDIFVLPSNAAESFGNSVVEAMGLGIPAIVMRDGGGLIEHITDGGGYIASDVPVLASLLRILCLSEDLRRSVGENGKKYVREKYTLSMMVQTYNEFYMATGETLYAPIYR
ncbi:MAG: glycosyltransferase [Nitrospirae bacterium]|nr:glycosyltransferase [Nitrospirota bacterium]